MTNAPAQCVISTDAKGMIEYWDINTFAQPGADKLAFRLKSDTDLYDLAKSRATPYSLAVAPTGLIFSTFSSDKQIRVFDFARGKLLRKYDESVAAYSKAAVDGAVNSTVTAGLDALELGRRQATERELEASPDSLALCNVSFDESGNFLVFGTLKGVKIVNVVTNKVVRVLGLGESGERFLAVALYQGTPKVDTQFLLSRAGSENLVTKTVDQQAEVLADPTVYCSSFKKRRFYCFSKREPDESTESRDKFNELPTEEERLGGTTIAPSKALAQAAILHTTMGDIHMKLYPEECPLAVENFATHVRNGYYDRLLFHRVIKGFMVQTGDPKGDGTGGESIWGREFEDEFVKTLRYVLFICVLCILFFFNNFASYEPLWVTVY